MRCRKQPAGSRSRRRHTALQVTERAVKRIRVAMAKEGISPEEGGLRLGVMGGGCSGLSYSIKFDTQPRERDRIFEYDGVRVFVDPKSFLYLNGMTLDYEETLMRQGFNFINPQVEGAFRRLCRRRKDPFEFACRAERKDRARIGTRMRNSILL